MARYTLPKVLQDVSEHLRIYPDITLARTIAVIAAWESVDVSSLTDEQIQRKIKEVKLWRK